MEDQGEWKQRECVHYAGIRLSYAIVILNLGGRSILASKPPHKDEINNIVKYLSCQIAIEGVEIRLNTPVTIELVIQTKPDVVIIATGAAPLFYHSKIKLENIYTADDVLKGNSLPRGKQIRIGGGIVGCETAEYLTGKSNEITIIEILDESRLRYGDHKQRSVA